MDITIVVRDLPYPLDNGGRIRTAQIAVNLSKSNSVTILCTNNHHSTSNKPIEFFSQHGVEVKSVNINNNKSRFRKRLLQLVSIFSTRTYEYYKFYSPVFQNEITNHLTSSNVDILIVEFSQMGYYDYETDILTCVDQHNVESTIMYRTYVTESKFFRKLMAYVEWIKYRKQEIENCKKFSLCLTTSENDSNELKKISTDLKCLVVPNGVDTKYFFPDQHIHKSDNVIFVGTISYYPNFEGLIHFCSNIWPKVKARNSRATLTIVGKDPPPGIAAIGEHDKSITVTGRVDDVRDYYLTANLVVVPLRIGGGTRLKILEAMAMGKAIVSTTIGTEGIDVIDGENIILRDESDMFAEAIVSVLGNPGLQKRLGQAGRELVEAKYNWTTIAENLNENLEIFHSQHQ